MTPAEDCQQPREPKEATPLPPKVLTALALAASGSTWDEAAQAVGVKAATLRRYHRKDPRCSEFIEQVVRENLNSANSLLVNALPRLASELIDLAMDKAAKHYSRVQAISEVFKIVNTNVLEAEQRRQLQAIREHLAALEEGTEPNVIDV